MDRIELTDSEKTQMRAVQILYRELEKKIEFCFGRDREEIQRIESQLKKTMEGRIDQNLDGYLYANGAMQRKAS